MAFAVAEEAGSLASHLSDASKNKHLLRWSGNISGLDSESGNVDGLDAVTGVAYRIRGYVAAGTGRLRLRSGTNTLVLTPIAPGLMLPGDFVLAQANAGEALNALCIGITNLDVVLFYELI